MAQGFTPRFGPIEFVRRIREDQLSVLTPDLFDRDMLVLRRLFLRDFVLNKPEYIEHVLLTNQANYRKSVFLRRMLGPVLGNGLLISEGEFWRRQRRIAAPVFHTRRIAEFMSTIADCTHRMLARWQRIAQPFDLDAEMRDLALAVIGRTMFSTQLGQEADTVRRLMDIFIALRPGLLDMFGFPEWIPQLLPRAYRAALAEFDALVARLIESRRRAAVRPDDLLSALLAARDPESGEAMREKQLRDEVCTILAAGHETVATALSWTSFLLAQNPDVEGHLHAEVDRVLGARPPTYADLAALPWTRMVIEEAMRLYPPAYAIARTAIGEDRIGGVRVPSGSLMTIVIYMTHRNPNLWPEPERFDPERFAPAAVAQRHRFAYLPFGGGSRVCIGNSFAMAEAQAIVPMIAQHFRLRLVPGQDIRPVGLITLRPNGAIKVRLEPRAVQAAA